MLKNTLYLEFLLNLSKTQAIIARRFDSLLGGLGLSEFIILYTLNKANDKMRRIDLAEKIGLTASGVTRLLLPMEKVGLVKREIDEQDGRVSYVAMSLAGKRKLSEAVERVDFYIDENLANFKPDHMIQLSKLMRNFFSTIK